MKILVDENIPLASVTELRQAGHEVIDIRRTPLAGMVDEELWKLAQAEEALLITTDKGFTRNISPKHFGLLVVRLKQPNESRIHVRIMEAMRRQPDDWPGLTVVMRDEVQSISRQF
jgi:predicted nuclease of predicted toxin-antitoxin system